MIQAHEDELVSMKFAEYLRTDALIKQLGEALKKAHHIIHYQREANNLEYASIESAAKAYEAWKAGRK